MKKSVNNTLVCTLILSATALTSRAGFFDKLESALGTTNAPTTATATPAPSASGPSAATLASLTPDELTSSVKELLTSGMSSAVASLGQTGGFATNSAATIPLPGKLQAMAEALNLSGHSQTVSNFLASMNQAAASVVPSAAPAITDSIQNLTVTNASSILAGPDDAATEYLRRTSETNLYTKLYPMVQQSTVKAGVTAQYKDLLAQYQAVNKLGSLFGSKNTVNFQTQDVDAFITQKTLDGMFNTAANQERHIRTNSVGQSALLQKVFASVPH